MIFKCQCCGRDIEVHCHNSVDGYSGGEIFHTVISDEVIILYRKEIEDDRKSD